MPGGVWGRVYLGLGAGAVLSSSAETRRRRTRQRQTPKIPIVRPAGPFSLHDFFSRAR